MTEITRVPIQPIAKGSLTKIWLGVVIAILLGAGLAWAAVPKGFSVDTLVAGEGDFAEVGDVVFVKYKGSLASNGEEFEDSEESAPPTLGILPEGTPFLVEEEATIPGFFQALQQVQEGGTYEVYIPAEMGYGSEPRPGGPIPPNADLIFEMEVVAIMSREETQVMMTQWQNAMQSQMGGLGAPGGPPATPSGQ